MSWFAVSSLINQDLERRLNTQHCVRKKMQPPHSFPLVPASHMWIFTGFLSHLWDSTKYIWYIWVSYFKVRFSHFFQNMKQLILKKQIRFTFGWLVNNEYNAIPIQNTWAKVLWLPGSTVTFHSIIQYFSNMRRKIKT